MSVDKETYINVLREELSILSTRYKPYEEGTGHINTAMYVIKSRIEELESMPSRVTKKAKENIKYIAKILAERKTGSQDNWNSFQDNFLGKAWDMVFLLEELEFLNKKKFWGE